MKRRWTTKNIGAATAIIKEGVVTTTTVRQTNVAYSKGLAHRENTENIGNNDVTKKVWRMTDVRSHIGTNNNHPGVPEECSLSWRHRWMITCQSSHYSKLT